MATKNIDRTRKKKVVMQKPSDEHFHKCRLCPYGTKYLQVIIDHVKRHGPKPGKLRLSCEIPAVEPLKCDFCDFEHDLKVVVERHTALLHGKSALSDPEILLRCYNCNKCPFETFSLLVFLRHACPEQDVKSEENVGVANSDQNRESSGCVQSENTRISETPGAQCHEKCSKNKSSKVNRKRKTAKTGSFFCEICSDKFKHALDLKQHELSDHNINQWFYCEYCSFKSLWKRGLMKHIRAKHAE